MRKHYNGQIVTTDVVKGRPTLGDIRLGWQYRVTLCKDKLA